MVNFQTTTSGTYEDADRRAARRAIAQANQQRETPLPDGTGPEIKASYETLLSEVAARWHAQNAAAAIRQERDELVELLRDATDAQIAQVKSWLRG